MTMGSQALADFHSRYHPREPILTRELRIPREHIQITGFQILSPAPATNIQLGKPPPLLRNERGTNTYLWVIDHRGVLYIIEEGIADLGGHCPKHTNLTGDGEAYVGGQLWFKTDSFLYVSGGSGRYPPISEHQLEDAIGVFRAFGYQVKPLGWDKASGPKRGLEDPS